MFDLDSEFDETFRMDDFGYFNKEPEVVEPIDHIVYKAVKWFIEPGGVTPFSSHSYFIYNRDMEIPHGKLRESIIKKYKKEKQNMSSGTFNIPSCTAASASANYAVNVTTPYYSFANLGTSTACISPSVVFEMGPPTQEKEKEHNMGYEMNIEADQRNGLKSRLQTTYYAQLGKLPKKYHTDGFSGSTKDEILAALKAGNIQFQEYFYDKDGKLKDGYVAQGTFNMTDPAADPKGQEAAQALLEKAYRDAKDTALFAPVADGFKALKDFEAATF